MKQNIIKFYHADPIVIFEKVKIRTNHVPDPKKSPLATNKTRNYKQTTEIEIIIPIFYRK